MTNKRDQLTSDEAKLRFEAALRGARIAGPQHKVKCDSEVPQTATEKGRKETPLEWQF